jgi:nephrocystin-3
MSSGISTSRTVRIFLSSTFRDFGEERDLLVRRVFPGLRARLKDRFVELVDVDLRWGITAEEAERGEVLPICLAEIDRSRPFFVGLLGERYGWVPATDHYAPDLLERQPWLDELRGGKSVTELEILHGVLNDPKMAGRALFYFRSPKYAKAKGGDYLAASDEDTTRQRSLKDRIRASGVRVRSYATPDALAMRIERDLWKILDAEFPASQVPESFERECLRHEAFSAPLRRLYFGGEHYQSALEKALKAKEPIIVIEGASGGGKSALVANFFEAYRKRNPRHLVHEHYLGSNADAADLPALLRRLIQFIQRSTNSNEEIVGSTEKLMDSLPLWLATASMWARRRKTRFVFMLDGLNSLNEKDLRWWPEFLPKGITMVVTCQPGQVLAALKEKVEILSRRDKRRSYKTIKLHPLTKNQSINLLSSYLTRFTKKLPTPTIKEVQAHTLATNPLFLCTLAEELRLFGVHEGLQSRLRLYLRSQTVFELFEKVLQRVEEDCGQVSVKVSLTAIWASRSGLAEKEIMAIAGLTPAAWAAIRYALPESLLEVSGRICFSHQFVRDAVSRRYLKSDECQRSAHRLLAQWFSRLPSGPRRVEEEPHQWLEARAWKALESCLVSWDTISLLPQNALHSRDLRRYWTALTSKKGISPATAYAKALPHYPPYRSHTLHAAEFLNELGMFLIDDSILSGLTEQLVRKALVIRRRALGPDHLNTFELELNLALVLSNSGQFHRANSLIQRCLKQQKSGVSKSSSRLRRAELYMAAGSASHDARRFKESEYFFKQAMKDYAVYRGRKHEDTLLAATNLVGALLTNNKVEQAKLLLDELCRVTSRRFDENASIVLVNEFNRAKLLSDLGQWGLAERAVRKLLCKDESLFGPRSAEAARDVELLGLVLVNRGLRLEGMSCYRRALQIMVYRYGRQHLRVAQIMTNIADVWFEYGAYPKAEKFLREVVDIMKGIDSVGSEALANLYNKLGLTIFMRSHTNPEVGQCFERALLMYELFSGPEESVTIEMMDTLGNWLVGMSEVECSDKRRAQLAKRGQGLITQSKKRSRSRKQKDLELTMRRSV